MRTAGTFLVLSLMAGACGVGEDGEPLEPIDPNPNRIACTSAFKTRGTWTAKDPLRPADSPTGCWPVGTWTFTATLDNEAEVLDIDGDGVGDRCEGSNVPQLAASYSFVVNRMDDGEGWVESYQYTGDTSIHQLHKVSVSEGGGGECEGEVELVSADKKGYWVLKPMQTREAIDGFGAYTKYLEPQPY
ncbi:MAG: hypothetical protein ACTHU0_27420 [Kofleriaceae bacterium]